MEIQPILSWKELGDTLLPEVVRITLNILGFYIAPDKICRKFVFGFKGVEVVL